VSAADYEWPRWTPDDRLLDVHRRAAINLLVGAILTGDQTIIARAYRTVTAFCMRTHPGYRPLDAMEVRTLLGLFESMPGGTLSPDEIRLETR
jgi:hypothetical protein